MGDNPIYWLGHQNPTSWQQSAANQAAASQHQQQQQQQQQQQLNSMTHYASNPSATSTTQQQQQAGMQPLQRQQQQQQQGIYPTMMQTGGHPPQTSHYPHQYSSYWQQSGYHSGQPQVPAVSPFHKEIQADQHMMTAYAAGNTTDRRNQQAMSHQQQQPQKHPSTMMQSSNTSSNLSPTQSQLSLQARVAAAAISSSLNSQATSQPAAMQQGPPPPSWSAQNNYYTQPQAQSPYSSVMNPYLSSYANSSAVPNHNPSAATMQTHSATSSRPAINQTKPSTNTSERPRSTYTQPPSSSQPHAIASIYNQTTVPQPSATNGNYYGYDPYYNQAMAPQPAADSYVSHQGSPSNPSSHNWPPQASGNQLISNNSVQPALSARPQAASTSTNIHSQSLSTSTTTSAMPVAPRQPVLQSSVRNSAPQMNSSSSNQVQQDSSTSKSGTNSLAQPEQPVILKNNAASATKSPTHETPADQVTNNVQQKQIQSSYNSTSQRGFFHSNPPTSQSNQSGYYPPYESGTTDKQKSTWSEKLVSETKSSNERDLSTSDSKRQSQATNSSKQKPLESTESTANVEDSLAALTISSSRKTTWASIASQPAKVSQPKSLKSKIAGSNSVLSSAKHLAVVSLDSSNSESKNGINPAIKSSVSAAATSIVRSSVPPPISKLPAIAASLKLNLLGEGNIETSRISWPAVNASINLSLDDPPTTKDPIQNNKPSFAGNSSDHAGDKHMRESDDHRNRDMSDASHRDLNHNHGSNSKIINSHRGQYSLDNGPSGNRETWNRRESQEHRIRRDSDRRESAEREKYSFHNENPRDFNNLRRNNDYHKPNNIRMNQQPFRGDDRDNYRDRDFNKRGAMNDHRIHDNPQHLNRFPQNRFEARDSHHNQNNNHRQPPQHSMNRHSENNQQTQHHHYNNVRDGNTAGNSLSKIDLSLHPHLNPANFNPKTFNLEPDEARYFIIKSYSEDDIHRSIKYSIWCSTNHGNKRLDEAYRQQQSKNGPIYLFFSVNGSGHFCGMAQMTSSVDFDSSSGVWAQSKWQGEFSVKWTYVKDVPNSALRHITLENNEDKPVTNSRDTQEVPSEKGRAVLKILHQFPHTTSIFDDFLHYERRQEEEKFKKSHNEQQQQPQQLSHRSDERDRYGGGGMNHGRGPNRPFMNSRPHHNDFHSRDRPSRFAS